MKLIDAIKYVDKEATNCTCADWEDLGRNCFDLECSGFWEYSDEIDARLKQYWIRTWYCTDTWVGTAAIWFDDKPVGFMHQTARKNDKNFRFIDEAAMIEVRNFFVELHIRALTNSGSGNPTVATFDDLDQDIGENMTTYHVDGTVNREGVYNDRKCKIVAKATTDYLCKQAVIVFEDGARDTVDIAEIKFPHKVKLP